MKDPATAASSVRGLMWSGTTYQADRACRASADVDRLIDITELDDTDDLVMTLPPPCEM